MTASLFILINMAKLLALSTLPVAVFAAVVPPDAAFSASMEDLAADLTTLERPQGGEWSLPRVYREAGLQGVLENLRTSKSMKGETEMSFHLCDPQMISEAAWRAKSLDVKPKAGPLLGSVRSYLLNGFVDREGVKVSPCATPSDQEQDELTREQELDKNEDQQEQLQDEDASSGEWDMSALPRAYQTDAIFKVLQSIPGQSDQGKSLADCCAKTITQAAWRAKMSGTAAKPGPLATRIRGYLQKGFLDKNSDTINDPPCAK